MNGHRGPKVLVLYQIVNSTGDGGRFNAFEMPVGEGVSLSSVKKSCRALTTINGAGPDGFHWRVRVDDKVSSSSTGAKVQRFSWWDIQDEKARLPVKQVSLTELNVILNGSKASSSSSSAADESVAKGAMRSLGKAMNKVAASVEGTTADTGPRTPIIMFKLVDMVKIQDSFNNKQGLGGNRSYQSTRRRTATNKTMKKQQTTHTPSQPRASPRVATRAAVPNPKPTPQRRATPSHTPRNTRPQPAEASLMDFGGAPSVPTQPLSSPTGQTKPNETRAEKLKREYEKKKQTEKKVWDPVDQRWVTEDTKNGASTKQAAKPASAAKSKGNIKAISLDGSAAIGKSATVAAAVNARVNDMKASQQKALNEIREREAAKKAAESEEDTVRQALEPKIKAWSEEHGKKKQLRALIASLHTILWPGAKWKPVNLGDILDDKKLRLAYHKAARVVHPDKIQTLSSPEQRFLAKRIFDALTQAKTDYDNSK